MMSRSARILLTVRESAEPPEAVSVESDLVVILAALLCALICVVGLLAVARCTWLRHRPQSPRQASAGAANKGLKKKVLQSLPKFTYTTNDVQQGFAESECAICLGDFVDGDELRVLPQCRHGFHVSCIDNWLGFHSSCPSCRQILVVARCHKCGHYPASISAASSEAQLKTGEDNHHNDMAHHHHHHHHVGFLP